MTLTLLTYIVVKTFLVFAGAWALARTLSRASAAARHLVWAMALGASVLLLAAPLAGPGSRCRCYHRPRRRAPMSRPPVRSRQAF